MFQLFELLWPAERLPMLCVVASLVLTPVVRVMLVSTFETLSPLAETVAVRVAEPPTEIGSGELSDTERLPAAKHPAESNTMNIAVKILGLVKY